MSETYKIVTDACSDIIPEYADKEGILVIPMEVVMTDGFKFNATYDNAEVPLENFYHKVEGGLMSSTTAVTPQAYLDFFRPLLQDGNDILYNCFTSGMSSTYNNALLVQEQLKEEFPDRRLLIVDSRGATGGMGYQTYFAALNRDQGMSIEDNAKWLEDTRLHINYTWTVSDLNHLRRGGRLTNIAAFAGTLLQLKPVGDINDEGQLVALGTVRGRRSSLKRLADIMAARIDVSADKPVLICHCECAEDAEFLKQKLLETGKTKEVLIGRVGPVVGTHLGPTGITVYYFCDHRGGLK
ncbi:MAG: DegV family protein [Solobacterium sp.]|jgi:DegV family protein with EDD domain|nr:DegV family protein [Solobacterium sp.]MCH4048414.1 DegV family protein [Solobacterium sp.]MCH4074734.1 DegV family protein [Solobacterium sp.]MCI1313915.1 DegV family protein [Solobacterium sp.]MCI1346985.1 DegV family protein [Solobacterium sp.]